MNKTTVLYQNFKLSFVDADVVDLDDINYEGEYNPHNQSMWLMHDHGSTLCVVMASNLQDALDAAVDNDKLDHYQIDAEDSSDLGDYFTTNVAGQDPDSPDYVDDEGVKYWYSMEPAFLGNASEAFDIESVGYVNFPLPKRSLAALYGGKVEATSAHFA